MIYLLIAIVIFGGCTFCKMAYDGAMNRDWLAVTHCLVMAFLCAITVAAFAFRLIGGAE